MRKWIEIVHHVRREMVSTQEALEEQVEEEEEEEEKKEEKEGRRGV